MDKKSAIYFSIASVGMNVLNMLSGIIIIKWVSPQFMGIWGAYAVFQTYGTFLQLGVLNGLNREFPFLLGANKKEVAHQLAATAKAVSFICTGLALLLFCIGGYILTFSEQANSYHFFAYGAVAFIGSSEFYKNYLIVIARANKAFSGLYKAYFFQCFVILISLILVYFWGFKGMVIRFVLIAFTLIIFLHIFRPLSIPAQFRKKNFITLFKIGRLIFSFGYIQGITNTFNRFVILYFANTTVLGLYSPVLALVNAVKILPSTLGQIIYPQMSFKIGEGTTKSQLWRLVWKPFYGLAIMIIPISIALWFIIPWGFNLMFPEYVSSILPAQIILISAPITGALIGINIFNSLKEWKSMTVVTVMKVVFYSLSLIVGAYIFKDDVLVGVSLGLVIADYLFVFSSLLLVRNRISKLDIPA